MPLDSSLATVQYQAYKDLGNGQTGEGVINQGLQAGEDLVNDVQKVEQRFNSNNIVTAATTVVKSGSGFLHGIVINLSAAGTITIYDNIAASGTKIATIAASAAGPTFIYNVAFSTGLTIVTGAASDITVSYR